jgi:hypothetical protein
LFESANANLSLAMEEHEYWNAESDPNDAEYYAKHLGRDMMGLDSLASTILFMSQPQQRRVFKAVLCGRRVFRRRRSGRTLMGNVLVDLWNAGMAEDNIDLLRMAYTSLLRAFRDCGGGRRSMTSIAPQRSDTTLEAIFASKNRLTTNAGRNRAAANIRKIAMSSPRHTRLTLASRALMYVMHGYYTFLSTHGYYVDPFASPFSDLLRTVFNIAP